MYIFHIEKEFLKKYFFENNLERIIFKNISVDVHSLYILQENVQNYKEEKDFDIFLQNNSQISKFILELFLFYSSNSQEELMIQFNHDFTLEDKDKIALWIGLKYHRKMILYAQEKENIEMILKQFQETYSYDKQEEFSFKKDISWDFLQKDKNFIQLINKNYENYNFLKQVQWNEEIIQDVFQEINENKFDKIVDLLTWEILLKEHWVDWGIKTNNVYILKKCIKIYYIYLNFLKEKEIPLAILKNEASLQKKELVIFQMIENHLLKNKNLLMIFLEKHYFAFFSMFHSKITMELDIFENLYEQIKKSQYNENIGLNLLNFYTLKQIELLFQKSDYVEIYLQYLEKVKNIVPFSKEIMKIFIKSIETNENHINRFIDILEYKKNSLGSEVIVQVWNLFSLKIKKKDTIILKFIELNPKIYIHLSKEAQKKLLFFIKYTKEQDIYEKQHWEKINLNILNEIEEKEMLEIMKKYPQIFLLEKFPSKWKENENIILETAKLGHKNIEYLTKLFDNDEKIISLLEKNYTIYQYIPYVKKLNIKITKTYLSHIPEFNQGNLLVIPKIMMNNKNLWVSLLNDLHHSFKKDNFNYFPKELWNYAPFILKIADLIDKNIIEKSILNNEPKIVNILENQKIEEGSIKIFLTSLFLNQNISQKQNSQKHLKI